jgi:6-pyruvoyl-tetrahydropterin synthase
MRKKTYTVEKVVEVCYAHKLPGHPHCDPLHGHNARITMSVTTTCLKVRPWGFIIDFGTLKGIAKRHDHSGEIVVASAERLAAAYGMAILTELNKLGYADEEVKEIEVTVEETAGSTAIWRDVYEG